MKTEQGVGEKDGKYVDVSVFCFLKVLDINFNS